jgi:hypothetical protein
MPLNPTGSEIPRSLTQVGTTIDAALNGKADFARIATDPLNVTVPSQYTITGEMFYDSGELSAPFFLDNDAENSWSSGSDFLVIDSGFWRLTLSQATWLSVESSSTLPQNCTWSAGDLTSGTPSLFFAPERPKQTGQFALVNNSVMWQNLGTDASPSWVALVKSGDLANYATIAAVNLKANIASPALTGNPTAPTQTAGNDSTRIATTAFVAASFATTSAVAAGYQPLDADLTAIAALTTTSTGRALLTESTAQTGTGALVRAASPTLTGTLAAAAITASGVITATGGATNGVLLGGASNGRIYMNTTTEQITFRSYGTDTMFLVSGSVSFNTGVDGAVGMLAQASAANKVALVARGTNSQTANPFEVRDISNTVVVSASVTGNLTASGTLRVGGGTVVANILSATATLDFPSIGSNGTETLTITVTGAVAGDSVFLGCPAGLDAGLIFCASVTAADTVTVRMHNSSGGSIDPASGTFRATVIRF